MKNIIKGRGDMSGAAARTGSYKKKYENNNIENHIEISR